MATLGILGGIAPPSTVAYYKAATEIHRRRTGGRVWNVAPVVQGEGVRFFGSHAGTVLLDDPDVVVQGDRVLHLHYTVKR